MSSFQPLSHFLDAFICCAIITVGTSKKRVHPGEPGLYIYRDALESPVKRTVFCPHDVMHFFYRNHLYPAFIVLGHLIVFLIEAILSVVRLRVEILQPSFACCFRYCRVF